MKIKITPLKDFEIYQESGGNKTHIKLREGIECEVPEQYLPNLITEEVIREKKVTTNLESSPVKKLEKKIKNKKKDK